MPVPAGQVPQFTWEVSTVSPVHVPPFSSCVCILRTRCWVPVPHVMLHADHVDQVAQTQFTIEIEKWSQVENIDIKKSIKRWRVLDVRSLMWLTCRTCLGITFSFFSAGLNPIYTVFSITRFASKQWMGVNCPTTQLDTSSACYSARRPGVPLTVFTIDRTIAID